MKNVTNELTRRTDAVENLQDRRQFLGTAAIGIVSASVAGDRKSTRLNSSHRR